MSSDYGITLTAKNISGGGPYTFLGEPTHRIVMEPGNISIHITPEIARQWVGVLSKIAKEK